MKNNLIFLTFLISVLMVSVVSAGLWITGDVQRGEIQKSVSGGDSSSSSCPQSSPAKRSSRSILSRSSPALVKAEKARVRVEKQEIVKEDLEAFKKIEGLLKEYEGNGGGDKLPTSLWEEIKRIIADMDRRTHNY